METPFYLVGHLNRFSIYFRFDLFFLFLFLFLATDFDFLDLGSFIVSFSSSIPFGVVYDGNHQINKYIRLHDEP
jgi:hypothetical protein